MGTFVCEKCEYSTSNRTHYERHCTTSKHLKRISGEPDSVKLTLHMYEILELKYQHELEKNALQTNFINLLAGTINKKATRMPVMDISGIVVSDEEPEQEPDQPPEPKLKKEPEWIPAHTFNEIQQHYDSQFTFSLIDQYRKYDDIIEKEIKDYDTYIEEELGDKDEQMKFKNEYTCDSFQFNLFQDCLKTALSNKTTVPCFDEQLRKFLKNKLSQEKNIKVLDANRSKFYLYGEKDKKNKWLDTPESFDLLKSFIDDIHNECIHQGNVFTHLYKDHPEFEKVLNAYNMHDKMDTFINKLLKEL